MRYVLFLLTASAFAGGPFDAPYRGCVHDRSGVRFVYGLRSSFVLSGAAMNDSTAAVCAADRVVAKLDASVTITDREGNVQSAHEAPSGPALLAFDEGGERAIAYFPEGGAALRWDGAKNEWSNLNINVEGTPLAIAVAGDDVLWLHRRLDRLWVSRTRSEALIAAEPLLGAASAALLWSDGSVLLADGATLRLRSVNGEEQIYEMPGAVNSLAHMSASWVNVETAEARIVMERTGGKLQQYFLAGGAQ